VTVVLHGGGPGCHAAADFALVLDRLPGKRFLLVDLPGYGRSDALDDHGPVFSGHAEALRRLLDRVHVDRVDLLGQSLGGSVALKLAADHPERVGRIALVGSQPVPGPPGTTADPGLGRRVRERYYRSPVPAAMRALMGELEWHDASRISASLVAARHAASVTPTALRTATGRGEPQDLTPDLGRVAAPTLVLWGQHDPFAGPDYALALTTALPAGDLAVLGRCAHHPQSERPDDVAALVAAHFREGAP
jgi:pimeloyl-ACP methyl ester carboxylesterase